MEENFASSHAAISAKPAPDLATSTSPAPATTQADTTATAVTTAEATPAPTEDPAAKLRPWYMKGGGQRPASGHPDLPLFPEELPNSDRIPGTCVAFIVICP